ncbi:ribonuclease III [Alteromonas sediminis]|uniref:Ribonuclease 3 n=1 Tax=Alteromonas sediminis TaxID=2259342 RepID=A0A3N5XYG1_9ALTE|nr:ribonuclease III [Alteromonas sediminis]RPJ65600.1 ribonuclease III [Alteromonas sediminis]
MQARPRFADLYEALGYTFVDEKLIIQALTHRSADKMHNERLEFLGDAVLGMVIAEKLYLQFSAVPEGNLTRMRATLVKGETLAEIGSALDLGNYIRLGSGEKKSGGHRRASILADAVEAVLGAIYYEAGLDVVKAVIHRLFEDRVNKLNPKAHPKDSKTQLQEWLQARKQPLPHYEVISITGKDHAQTFIVECRIANQSLSTRGSANSRRRAEQEAANAMLGSLNDV